MAALATLRERFPEGLLFGAAADEKQSGMHASEDSQALTARVGRMAHHRERRPRRLLASPDFSESTLPAVSAASLFERQLNDKCSALAFFAFRINPAAVAQVDSQ